MKTRHRYWLPVAWFLAAWFLLVASAICSSQQCQKLTATKIPGATITVAQTFAAGTFVPPALPYPVADQSAFYKGLPAFCRVVAESKPTALQRGRMPAGPCRMRSGRQRDRARQEARTFQRQRSAPP